MNLPNGLDPNDPLVKQARKGSKWDHNDQKRYDALKAAQAKSKAQAHKASQPAPKPSAPAPAKQTQVYKPTPAPTPTKQPEVSKPENTPTVKPPTPQTPTQQAPIQQPPTPQPPTQQPPTQQPSVNPSQSANQSQKIQQDNDINTTIDGNNNYVNNQQDNSIRQYGGDNRQFTYVGGKNSQTDTPASMATMAGFYDVDDSPAAQAKFTDLYSSLNKDSQKKYSSTSNIALGAIHRANQYSTIDTNALDKRVHDRQKYSRAKADMMGMNLFGDIYNYTPTDFKSPIRQSEVETPDFEKMYDKYTDF